MNPSNAGSRVRAASTVMATVAAAATATPFISGWRSTSRPSMPMTTVVPAVSTDRPAVRMARSPASAGPTARCACPGGRPPGTPRRYSRNRVTMNSA